MSTRILRDHLHREHANMKRKRKSKRDERDDRLSKRTKIGDVSNGHPTCPLLQHYYPKVLTLRQYLLGALSQSKKRQRRLLHYGLDSGKSQTDESHSALTALLDNVIIGASSQAKVCDPDSIDRDITLFTQQLSDSTATISPTQAALKQTEVGLPASQHRYMPSNCLKDH